MYDTADTIAAITTPLGESGIGAVRISGPGAYAVGDKIFKSKSEVPLKERRDRSIQYGTIVDENGNCIDEVLALIMKGPHSYTAEDVLEIQCHGGREALESILQLILRSGARMANPGEFTERAFVNGRIDLAQAEAVMDVIQAKSRAGLTSAVSQLEGRLSKVINKTRNELTELVTRLEVMIDYPEEDLERYCCSRRIGRTERHAEKIAAYAGRITQSGRMIRDGVMAAIAGTPNAGKSSLLNRLLQEERAIVTDVPGTTRDVLEEWITLRGIPVCLVDTAGIRETDDTVEKIGVSRARQYLDRADIILAVIDSSRPLTEEDKDILQSVAGKNVIVVLNKTDLPPVVTSKDLSPYGFLLCPISASTGKGLDKLKDMLLQEVLKGGFTDGPSALLTNTRHIELVRQSAEALNRAQQSLQDGMPLDCAVVDIRQAWDALGSITGDTVHDDIVEEIFSRFCLGK